MQPFFVVLVAMLSIGATKARLVIVESGFNPVEVIVSSYNLNSYDKLYGYFSQTLQSKITLDTFRSAMYDIHARLSIIEDYFSLDSGNLLTVHSKELDTAVFKYALNANQQQFDSFVVSYAKQSIFSYFKQQQQAGTNRSSLSFWTPAGAANFNQQAMLSVCSVYKITLVLEYARQVGKGVLLPDSCIPLDYLNRYYLPHIDSGHKMFLDNTTGDCAKLDNIVIGMIAYSSNAIAEYLTDLLSPENVDSLVQTLGMQHSPTLYVCSSMLALNNTRGLPYEQYVAYLKTLTPEWVRQQSFLIHAALKDKTLTINDSFYLDPNVIDVHAEMLEKSTAESYRTVMQKVALGNYFPPFIQTVIYRLFDAVDMQSAFSKKAFVHSGAKGGSANYPGMTNAALAISGFMQLKNQTDKPRVYSLIFNGLTPAEFAVRLQDMNIFVAALAVSDYFVVEFVRRLQS